VAVTAACSSEPTSVPETVPGRPEVAGVPPDTGALGLAPVDGVPLFVLVNVGDVTDTAARRRLDAVGARPTSAAVRVARLVGGADTLLTAGRALAFDVNPTRRLVFAGIGSRVNPTGTISWFGELRGGRFGQTNLVYSAASGVGHITGGLSVLPPDGATYSYSVQPLGGGYHVIVYVDYTKFPPGEG